MQDPRLMLLAGAAILALAPCANSAFAHEQPPSARPARAAGLSNLRVGDVVSDDGGVSVEVPPPGTTVDAYAEGWGAAAQSLSVTTDDVGSVHAASTGDDAGEGAGSWGAAGTLPDDSENGWGWIDQCVDPTYRYLGGVAKGWSTTMKWWWTGFNPTNDTATAFESQIKLATTHVADSLNVCNLADYVDAQMAYQGKRSGGVNITDTATCGSRDGFSVVGGGTLPLDKLAYACIWRNSTGSIVEADVKLNTSGPYRWFLSKDACRSDYAANPWHRSVFVMDVFTHERIHSLGLADLYDDAESNMTMYGYFGPCQSKHRTLGLGDIKGLRSLY